jgi:hypothetical protein
MIGRAQQMELGFNGDPKCPYRRYRRRTSRRAEWFQRMREAVDNSVFAASPSLQPPLMKSGTGNHS